MEGRFCDEVEFLVCGRVVAFFVSCPPELNDAPAPPHYNCIKSAYQPVKGVQSPIYSTASLLFSTIVAVVEVEVGR